MEHDLELASFRGDDDPSLVAAALACRVCLSGDVDWALEMATSTGRSSADAATCGYTREVSLTSEQTLRLSLQRAALGG